MYSIAGNRIKKPAGEKPTELEMSVAQVLVFLLP